MASDESKEKTPPSFEVALTRLEAIVRDLEEGDLGLAEALTRYETGIGLLKSCHELLERAERKIELLSGFDAEGNPITTPFDDTESATLDAERQHRSRKRSAGNNRTDSERPKRRASDPPQIDEPTGLF
jgi:exodeoxyribonuclease VII small subunit